MTREKTLRKVEYDLSLGRYEKARDRLNGLIGSYPSDLTLWRKLGDIHYHLGNPRKAGRYWYLEEHKTPEMVAACKLFEKACGGNPVQIGRRLKFKGNIKTIQETHPFAAEMLLALHKWAKEEHGYTLHYIADPSFLSKLALNGLIFLGLIIYTIFILPILIIIVSILYLLDLLFKTNKIRLEIREIQHSRRHRSD